MKFIRALFFTFYFLLFTFLLHAQTNYISHTIISGETLSALAKQYHTTVGSIMRLNGMNTKSVLTIGEVVKIPTTKTAAPVSAKSTVAADAPVVKAAAIIDTTGKQPITHIVGKGESLYSIAKKYHVYIAQIKTWNNLKSDVIVDGKSLIVGYTAAVTNAPTTTAVSTPVQTKTRPVQPSETQSQQDSEPVEKKPTVQSQQPVVNAMPPSATVQTTTNIPSTSIIQNNTTSSVASIQPSQNEVANMTNPEGYFTSAFGLGTEGRSIQTATGTSMTFKTASGWNDKKYYILMNNVPPGSIVKIMAPNYKTIFAKVLWGMSAMKENAGLDYRISTAAASGLGLSEAKFQLTITYFE